MNKEELKEKVLEIISDKGLMEKEEVQWDEYWPDNGIDSLTEVEIVMECEHEFNITIPDEIADGFKNPSELLNYLESQLIQ